MAVSHLGILDQVYFKYYMKLVMNTNQCIFKR